MVPTVSQNPWLQLVNWSGDFHGKYGNSRDLHWALQQLVHPDLGLGPVPLKIIPGGKFTTKTWNQLRHGKKVLKNHGKNNAFLEKCAGLGRTSAYRSFLKWNPQIIKN